MSRGAPQQRSGFSMVEVVLAVLILGVGVLTVVGLMSGGLQMSKNGMDEMQAALFAGDVLEGLQRHADVATNTTVFRNQIETALGSAPLRPVAGSPVGQSMWVVDNQNTISREKTTPLRTQPYFYYAPQAAPASVDFVCRYQLFITRAAPGEVAANQAIRNRVAALQVKVQSGRFGQTTTQSFYREVFQFVK